MERTFTVTCTCGHSFPVDYEIRFADVELECPACRRKIARRGGGQARRALGLTKLWGSARQASKLLASPTELAAAVTGDSPEPSRGGDSRSDGAPTCLCRAVLQT